MRKKLAVIVAVRYRDGELLRGRFLEKHGNEYDARVVTHPEKLRGYMADLYIRVYPGQHISSTEFLAWTDLLDMVSERSSKNDAPVHNSRRYE